MAKERKLIDDPFAVSSATAREGMLPTDEPQAQKAADPAPKKKAKKKPKPKASKGTSNLIDDPFFGSSEEEGMLPGDEAPVSKKASSKKASSKKASSKKASSKKASSKKASPVAVATVDIFEAIKPLQQQLTSVAERLSALQEQHSSDEADATRALEVLQQKLNVLEDQLAAQPIGEPMLAIEEKLSNIEIQVKESEAPLSSLQEEFITLREKVESLHTDLDKKKEQDPTSVFESIQIEVHTLEDSFLTLQQNVADLQEQLSSFAELKQQLPSLADLEKQLSSVEETVASLPTEEVEPFDPTSILEPIQIEVHTLEDSFLTLQQSVEDLAREVASKAPVDATSTIAALQNQVEQLTESLSKYAPSDLVEEVLTQKEDLQALQELLEDLPSKAHSDIIALLEERLDATDAKVEEWNTASKTVELQQKLDSIEPIVKSLSEADAAETLVTLQTSVSSLEEYVIALTEAEIESTLKLLQSRLSTMEQSVAFLNEANTTQKMEALQAKLDRLGQTIESLGEEDTSEVVEQLQTKLEAVEQSVKVLEDTEATSQQVESLEQKLAALEATTLQTPPPADDSEVLDALQQQVERFEQKLAALEATTLQTPPPADNSEVLDALQQQFESLEQKLASLTQEESADAEALELFQARLDKVESQLEQHTNDATQEQLQQLAKQVVLLASRVDLLFNPDSDESLEAVPHQQDIKSLEEEIKRLQEAMEQQTASSLQAEIPEDWQRWRKQLEEQLQPQTASSLQAEIPEDWQRWRKQLEEQWNSQLEKLEIKTSTSDGTVAEDKALTTQERVSPQRAMYLEDRKAYHRYIPQMVVVASVALLVACMFIGLLVSGMLFSNAQRFWYYRGILYLIPIATTIAGFSALGWLEDQRRSLEARIILWERDFAQKIPPFIGLSPTLVYNSLCTALLIVLTVQLGLIIFG